MEKGTTDRLDGLTHTEQAMRQATSAALHQVVNYFEYLEETVLIALGNSNKPFRIPSDRNSPLLLAVVATARSAAIAKLAMDAALSGHPLEAIALTRILGEIAQSTQYLVRHPEKIDRFVSGSFKLDRLLKAAKAELPAGTKDAFGHFRGIASEYAHASPNMLAIALLIQGPSLKAPVIITDLNRAEDAAVPIVGTLLTQYFIFRLALRDSIEPLGELAKRDAELLDPSNARAILSEDMFPGSRLEDMRAALEGVGSG